MHIPEAELDIPVDAMGTKGQAGKTKPVGSGIAELAGVLKVMSDELTGVDSVPEAESIVDSATTLDRKLDRSLEWDETAELVASEAGIEPLAVAVALPVGAAS